MILISHQFLSSSTHSPPPDKLLSRLAFFLHPSFCHMLQDDPSLIVAVISVIHIASLICLLFTQSSLMSLSTLMYPSVLHHSSLHLLTSLFISQSTVPFPLFSPISIYLFHPLT